MLSLGLAFFPRDASRADKIGRQIKIGSVCPNMIDGSTSSEGIIYRLHGDFSSICCMKSINTGTRLILS